MQEAMVIATGWTLVHSLWQGAILALLLYILQRWGKLSPQARYVWASSLLLALPGMALLTFFWVYEANPGPVITLETAFPLQGGNAAAAGAGPSRVSFSDWLAPYIPWLTWIWCMGVGLSMLRGAINFIHMQELRYRQVTVMDFVFQKQVNQLAQRMGISKTLLLLESTRIHSPLTLGHLKPVVLVPLGLLTNLPPAQIEAILAHEVAHIARKDFLINLIQTFIEALFFYHPVAWWISQQIREAREHCCDDIAVALTDDKMNYARALTAVAEHVHTPQFTLAMNGQNGTLLNRIKRLFGRTPSARKLPLRAVVGMLMLISLISVAWVSPETVTQLEPQNWAETFQVPVELFPTHPHPTPAPAPSPAPAPTPNPQPTLAFLGDTPPPPPPPPIPDMSELPPIPPMPPMPPLPDVDWGGVDWEDEAASAEARAKMKTYEEQMEAWGQQYGQQMEAWGRQFGEQFESGMDWEAYGKQMEAWGESFQERFESEETQRSRENARERAEAAREDAYRAREEAMVQAEQAREQAMAQAEIAREQALAQAERAVEQAERQLVYVNGQQDQIVQLQMDAETMLAFDRLTDIKGDLSDKLVADGLIAPDTKKVKVKIDGRNVKVNGKKLPNDKVDDYASWLTDRGINVDEDVTIIWNIEKE